MQKEFIRQISTRADVLARRYYFLEKEDMMQNGYILLMELEQKQLDDLQKFKAINNMFSKLEREALYKIKIERNASSMVVEEEAEDQSLTPEEILGRDEVTEQLMKKLTSQEFMVIEWLAAGYTIKEILETMGIHRDTLRRIVNSILRKRTEVEDAM